MDKEQKNKIKNEEIKMIKDLLDKKIELERMRQKKTPCLKIIAFIFAGVAVLGFLAFSCYMMYVQSLTMETLLAVLLSFFSIVLSIMFYIQSEKASSSYYRSSYEIMKEVSVTLGKIEASFGEKLTHINEVLLKQDDKKIEVQKKIAEGEKEQKELETKLTKESSEKERLKLVEKLMQKTEENYELKQKLRNIQMHSKINDKMKMKREFFNELLKKDFKNKYINIHSFNETDLDID